MNVAISTTVDEHILRNETRQDTGQRRLCVHSDVNRFEAPFATAIIKTPGMKSNDNKLGFLQRKGGKSTQFVK